jgi:hypothetical protein
LFRFSLARHSFRPLAGGEGMGDRHYLFRRKQLSVPTCILMAEWWKGVVCQAWFATISLAPCGDQVGAGFGRKWNSGAQGKAVNFEAKGDIIGKNYRLGVNP